MFLAIIVYLCFLIQIVYADDCETLVAATIILSIANVVCLMVISILCNSKAKKFCRDIIQGVLVHFPKCATVSISPEQLADIEAELLPYDKKWEFPKKQIKFGKQVGSGAFGDVWKAEASGIVEGDTVTTVAVKMLRKNADHIQIKALVSELKVMSQLGKHLNVVSLLGACTKNLAKRELLVIMDFCYFGNLQNYLLHNRSLFINQLNPKTREIDLSLGSKSHSRNISADYKNKVLYAELAFSNVNRACVSDDSEESSVTMLSNPSSPKDDKVIYSELRFGKGTGEPQATRESTTHHLALKNQMSGTSDSVKENSFCTSDLIYWAFQVAQGMEYLTSKKVIHRDLSARNIRLTDKNIVKISHFCLAKNICNPTNENIMYDGPLPIKKMAIESIRDRVFSSQSDVWSFGIVLWEFFSLARTPYNDMEDEMFYQKLLEGYRMECPKYCTKKIYEIMMDCWKEQPAQRPTFSELSQCLENMLEENVLIHYMDESNSYKAKNQNKESGYISIESENLYDCIWTASNCDDEKITASNSQTGMLFDLRMTN